MFWSELNKISSVGKQISDTVGNASGPTEIAQIFHDKYKALYNSVSTSEDELRLYVKLRVMAMKFLPRIILLIYVVVCILYWHCCFDRLFIIVVIQIIYCSLP